MRAVEELGDEVLPRTGLGNGREEVVVRRTKSGRYPVPCLRSRTRSDTHTS